MKRSIPLWAAAICWLATIAGAAVWAQGKKPAPQQPTLEYGYLPRVYSTIHTPTVGEWLEMRFNAANASTIRVTPNFRRLHLKCILTKSRLLLTMDLEPQPGWKHYRGRGKFSGDLKQVKADLGAAIDQGLKTVRQYFPEIRDRDIGMVLFINSESAGIWDAGKLTLGQLKPPAQR